MSVFVNPNIVLENLVFYLDPSNKKSYSGSGLTVNNLITSGFAGTLVNGATIESALRKTFIFDGTNDYLTAQIPNNIGVGSSVSIGMWAKWLTVGSNSSTIQVLLDNDFSTNGFIIRDMPSRSGAIEWIANFPGFAVTAPGVGNNQWHYIVATNDRVNSRIYIDGIESGIAKSSAGLGLTQSVLTFGRQNLTTNRYYSGSISNTHIYNRALNDNEIKQNYYALKTKFYPMPYYATDGLVVHYDFSNYSTYPGTGSVVYDLTEYGNDGVLVNNPAYSLTYSGNFYFDGTDDYIRINKNTSTTITQYISFEVWFTKAPYIDGFLCLVGSQIGSTADNSYIMWFNYEGFRAGAKYQDSWIGDLALNYTDTISNDTWYHAVYTYDGAVQKMYLNGSVVQQSGAAGTILYDPANLYITLGADCEVALNGGIMGFHKGRIGLFRLYNKALSSQEVLNNYDDSKSRFGY